MMNPRHSGELSETTDVKEANQGGDVKFSKESLEWYNKLMDEDIGEIDTSLENTEIEDKDRTGNEAAEERTISEAETEEKAVNRENPERATLLPRNGGEWTGEPGDSEWIPDRDGEPGDRNGTNPEHKKWGEILDNYDIDGIPFEDGEADFSEVSKGDVRIDDFSDDRASNFTQADEKLAEQRGCSPEEVAGWRREQGYTWHECKDCTTMQKVPTEVHGNISHSGGISEYKARNGEMEDRGDKDGKNL